MAKPGQVCLLKRSLYGLKQASREWNAEFCAKLLGFGLRQSAHDHCLFVKAYGDYFLALLVYVDDVLITGSYNTEIQSLKDYLHVLFTIKDLGFAEYFLGLEIARSEQGLFLSQCKYILDILEDTGFAGCKPAHTPIPQGIKLSGKLGTPLADLELYRRLIGRLL